MQIYLPVGFAKDGKFTLEQLDARMDAFDKAGIEQRLQIQMQEGIEDFIAEIAGHLSGAVYEPVLFHDRHGYISERKRRTILADLELIAYFADKAKLKQKPIFTFHGQMMFKSWEEAVSEHRGKGRSLMAPTYNHFQISSAKRQSLNLLGKIKRRADTLGIEVLIENVPELDYVYEAGADTGDKRWKGWLPELIDLGALYVKTEDLNYASENLRMASAVDIEHLVFTYGESFTENAIVKLRNVKVAHAGAGNHVIVNRRIGSHLPFIEGYDGGKPLVDWAYVTETFPRYLRALMDKGVEILVHEHHLAPDEDYVGLTTKSIKQLQNFIQAAESTS